MNERERFEAWFRSKVGASHEDLRNRHAYGYASDEIQRQWRAWQAALADRQEPAQPVGAIVGWRCKTTRSPDAWLLLYGDENGPEGAADDPEIIEKQPMCLAAPPSHPAPSEAAPERQEAQEGDPIVGHKTFRDGDGYRHEPLRQSEADTIMLSIEQSKRRRTDMMPDEQMAVRLFFDAWLRLQDFGWRNAIYCPKDGTVFEAIEAGSTGKHRCLYQGEWPQGSWWIVEDGDMCPSRPVLYRDLLAAQPAKGEGK